VLNVLRFVRTFIDENPLCCCSDEISTIKRKLIAGSDELKLKQRSSSVVLKVIQGVYFIRYNIVVPENYPDKQVSLEEKGCNFPALFKRWFLAQANEIARQCVVPPAKKRPKDPPFVLKPSLEPVISFLISEVRKYVDMECKFCKQNALPLDPK
ncbi:hypothetical protein SK128_005504, partial [Halocaridina rubra]